MTNSTRLKLFVLLAGLIAVLASVLVAFELSLFTALLTDLIVGFVGLK